MKAQELINLQRGFLCKGKRITGEEFRKLSGIDVPDTDTVHSQSVQDVIFVNEDYFNKHNTLELDCRDITADQIPIVVQKPNKSVEYFITKPKPQDNRSLVVEKTECDQVQCIFKLFESLDKGLSEGEWKLNGITDKDLRFINEEGFKFDNALASKFHKMLDPFTAREESLRLRIGKDRHTGRLIAISARTNKMNKVENGYFANGKKYERNNPLDYVFKPFCCHLEINDICRILGDVAKNDIKSIPEVVVRVQKDNSANSNATLFFAASAIEKRTVFVEPVETAEELRQQIGENFQTTVTQNSIDLINATQWKKPKKIFYNNGSPDEYLTKFGELFDDIDLSLSNLDIYKVGQANLIYGHFNCGNGIEKRIAFDFGIPNCRFLLNEESKVTFFGDLVKMRPHAILISHWHWDHFGGMFMLSKRVLETVKVFAPNYYKDDINQYTDILSDYRTNDNTRLLIDFLEFNNNLVCYENQKGLLTNKVALHHEIKNGDNKTVGTEIKQIPNIKAKDYLYYNSINKIGVYQRNNPAWSHDYDYDNLIHDQCLIVKLGKTLLPGDCEYYSWPDALSSPQNPIGYYKNIVVPHHGSYRSLPAKADDLMNNTKLYVCTGNNDYPHPNEKRVLDWHKKHYDVEYTNFECEFDDTDTDKPTISEKKYVEVECTKTPVNIAFDIPKQASSDDQIEQTS